MCLPKKVDRNILQINISKHNAKKIKALQAYVEWLTFKKQCILFNINKINNNNYVGHGTQTQKILFIIYIFPGYFFIHFLTAASQ